MTSKCTIQSLIGNQFVYRTAEVHPYATHSILEGQTLKVVGFRPQYKNTVLVEDIDGAVVLMRLDSVEKLIRSQKNSHDKSKTISDLPCEATEKPGTDVPCGRPATHVLEFEDEEGRKHLFLCNEHADHVDKRTILDDWADVSVTPL